MQDIRLFNNESSRMKVSSRTQPECVRKQEIVNFSGDQADDRILEHLIQTIKAGAAEVESGGHWPKGALLYMTKIKGQFYVIHYEPKETF